MSLGGALQIGRSGLLSSQAALDVVGNNLANVATRGYHRQSVALSPANSQEIQNGVFVGRGVQLQSITRQIDAALEARLRAAIADQSGSLTRQELLGQIEAIENEFTDVDLSSQLGAFFNAWSNLANNPEDISLRSLVLQEATGLATHHTPLRPTFVALRTQVDRAAEGAAANVNNLLDEIESLNHRIAIQEHGSGGAAGLRDQRDLALADLAQYLDISTVEADNGKVDIFVGSLPIMINGQSRGVELRTQTVDGQPQARLVVAADGSPLDLSVGQLGAMLDFRQNDLADAIATLDTLAHELAWQVNRVHSQGQGLAHYDSLTGTARVADPAAALNDPAAGLNFTPSHGSFQIHVTQKSTGERITRTVYIDLDGINPASDTTLASLAADLDTTANLSASVTADGRLQLSADSDDFQISFSDDTSGVLAALGVHTFFSGNDATDLAVNQALVNAPQLLAAGQGHLAGDNRNALAIVALREQGVAALSGFSLTQYWNRHVEDFAARLGQARSAVAADTVVRENLEAQQQSVSGVNADEEAIDLIRYQRAYQASARFLSVVDELLQTLMALV